MSFYHINKADMKKSYKGVIEFTFHLDLFLLLEIYAPKIKRR